MNYVNMDYVQLLREITETGYHYSTRGSFRKRIKAKSVSFAQTPLVSIRQTAWKNALREWEWFMSGSSDIRELHPSVRDWWKPWAEDEYVRHNYSEQFRCYTALDLDTGQTYFDQINWFIEAIKKHPYSTRNLITTWNTYDMQLPDCKITNCHGTVIHAFVENELLSLTTYQRSCDTVCGVPHNWIQYWAFLHWLAHRTGFKVGELVWIGGDVHIYDEHIPIVHEIMHAWDAGGGRQIPELVYTPSGEGFKADDFTLFGSYEPVVKTRAKMIL